MSILKSALHLLETCDTNRTSLRNFARIGDIVPSVSTEDFPDEQFEAIGSRHSKTRWHLAIDHKADGIRWKRRGFHVYLDKEHGSVWVVDLYWNQAIMVQNPGLPACELNTIAAQFDYNVEAFLNFLAAAQNHNNGKRHAIAG